MGFAERAVIACDRAMSDGTLSERHVRDVLRCKNVNVQFLAKHFGSGDSMTRRAVARIIGKLGDVTPLLDAALREKDSVVLREMLHVFGERGEGAMALGRMISSEDGLVREEAISMLRRSGNADSLLPLLFDKDDALVKRVKRYIYEQKRCQDEESGTREPR